MQIELGGNEWRPLRRLEESAARTAFWADVRPAGRTGRTRSLARLLALGLVEVVAQADPDDDGSALVTLTAAGREAQRFGEAEVTVEQLRAASALASAPAPASASGS